MSDLNHNVDAPSKMRRRAREESATARAGQLVLAEIVRVTPELPLVEITGGDRDTLYVFASPRDVAVYRAITDDDERKVYGLVLWDGSTRQEAERSGWHELSPRTLVVVDDGFAVVKGGEVVAIFASGTSADLDDDLAGTLAERLAD